MNQTLLHLRSTQRMAGLRLVIIASIYAILTTGFVASILHGPSAPQPGAASEPTAPTHAPVAMR